uniref:Lipocalin/cytosolic fatty-acid binding domain-containing protein n=1 Tax=Xiphophorus couchianus TaxID=32473 RepID=A0A3B5LFU5_9TELE
MIPALLLLPLLLKAAALHYLLGITILTALPILVLSYYYATHQRKRRTLFFLTLALYSLVILNEWFLIFCLLQLVGGKWYLIGFATNSKWFINIKNTMKMGVATLVSTAEGDVDLSYLHLLAAPTALAGEGATGPKRLTCWGSKNDIIVVDVKYDDYALVYDIKTKQKVNKIIHLYGKDLTSSATFCKFKQLALDAGTLAENIVFLPKNEQCPQKPPRFLLSRFMPN